MTESGSTNRAVVVTRAESHDGPLSTLLRQLGLQVLLWPTVSVTLIESDELQQALEQIETYDWIVFTSRNSVTAVIEHVSAPPRRPRVAAVGPATAQLLQEHGWRVDLVPEESTAVSLVASFARESCNGARVLFPASSRALPTLPNGLKLLGAHVHQVVAYRTDAASLDVASCRTWIERQAVGAVTFASPSAVVELDRALGRADFDRLFATATPVAIGTTTARALEERGRTAVVAESATLQGLAQTTHRIMQTRH